MPWTEQQQKRYVTEKARLTRAVKSGDPERVIQTARAALAYFAATGYPDDWSRWTRALDDAERSR